ncbi:MAG: DNA translocase FtsK [Bauldia sp.]|nr:DNA translocase FtsK [Bauldia sp.]
MKPTPRDFARDDDEGTILRRILRRNVSSLSGLLVLALVAAATVALATWHADDPSFSNAVEADAQNLLGYPGAVLADLVMQFLGIAAPLLLLPAVVWGWRLLIAAPTRFRRLTVLAWLGGVVIGAGAAASLGVPESWPLPTGLGGVLGDLAFRLPAAVLGSLGGFAMAIAGLVLAVASGALLFKATGFSFRRRAIASPTPRRTPAKGGRATPAVRAPRAEPRITTPPRYEEDDDFEEEGRRSRIGTVLVGAAAHAGYRIRSSFDRLMEARQRRRDARTFPGLSREARPATFVPRAARQEPRLTRGEQRSAGDDVPLPEETFDDAIDTTFDEDDAFGAFDPADDGLSGGEARKPRAFVPPPRPLRGPASAPAQPQRRIPVAEPAAPAGASAAQSPAAARLAAAAARRRGPSRSAAPAIFELPPLDLLAPPRQAKHATVTKEMLEENARILESVLDDFGIRGEIINVRPGPVVTLYELEPAPGIKSARVIGLADDIARSMSAIACRVAVIPGKNAIGIELPNEFRETVFLREQLSSKDFIDSKARLPLCLGKTIGGEPVVADLSRMPHLLVAGTTGSGKSVAINTMILSLLYRLTPEACRLILIDPKMLELSVYDGIPHLLTPVVTDPKKAVVALKWTVREMEDRYRKMSKLGVRNIDGLNARITQAIAKGETISRTVHTGFDSETGEPILETEELDLKPMPHIVVIIDEMADLMMVAGKDIEGAVQRLAQMARAAGIHVAMATQRPSVDVITGTIKANFPTRISFQVTSKIDSRTILGEQGAEQLLGQGDMLYMVGGGRIQRVHGPFVSDAEVEKVVAHLKAQGVPDYLEAITADEEGGSGEEGGEGGIDGEDSSDVYDQAVAVVIRDRKASTSYIQRRLGIGYNRAASLIERMEKEGVVGAANHAGKREILVPGNEERF